MKCKHICFNLVGIPITSQQKLSFTYLVHNGHMDHQHFLVGICIQVYPVHYYILLPLHMGYLLSKDRQDSPLCFEN